MRGHRATSVSHRPTAALDRGIRRCGDPDLGQHPDRVQLARRLDHPGQRQYREHLVAPTGPIESQHLVGGAQRFPQMPGLTRHDRRLVIAEPTVVEVRGVLVGVQPLPGDSLQHLYLGWGMRRPDVLDLPRPTPVRVHDLHRGRPAPGLHRPDVRHQHRLENTTPLVHNPPTKSPSQGPFQLQNGQT